jgi:hypothetical protein
MAGINKNVYIQILEKLFSDKYKRGDRKIDFNRDELPGVANALGIRLPKNLGDVIYTFRYRLDMPESISQTAPDGEAWVIRSTGKGYYQFSLIKDSPIAPSNFMAVVKIPDGTPGIIMKYSLEDEQSLLAKVRYNRLIDIFTGVTSYSLQNHLRTTVPGMGQIETDEIYIGIDRKGAHYVFPVQAKGGSDRLGIVQIEQDIALCAHKFPNLICMAIAVQFLQKGVIAMLGFENRDNEGVVLVHEKHYCLVNPDHISLEELKKYRESPSI